MKLAQKEAQSILQGMLSEKEVAVNGLAIREDFRELKAVYMCKKTEEQSFSSCIHYSPNQIGTCSFLDQVSLICRKEEF
jgi:hypothetical protein